MDDSDPEPAALSWSIDDCSLGRAATILGERWTLIVLREVFLGITRFDLIHQHAGVPTGVLSRRLAMLVRKGILQRVPYQACGERTRLEYRLTGRGEELKTVLIALATWGDRHLADPGGAPIVFVDPTCGGDVHVDVRCAHGHPVASSSVVSCRPGPGLRPDVG